jgi:hypothetical protein
MENFMQKPTDLQIITANLEQLPREFSPDVIAGRVETGPLQINEDWPGIFIRGDNAGWYAMQLHILLQSITPMLEADDKFQDHMVLMTVKGLVDLLGSCNVHGPQF